ncbi:DMT family transporter [Mariluticola halotolerans]|uniref:DMT family transporter n=1 Tax=Mariluticola halotolerans TaxID=2909283 RepID=UPI0026E3743C|nr:DMT family transporter [Mariluticola halotolerans]UJQ95205.1 DMT family transporter [Mariluticola halotolerans]
MALRDWLWVILLGAIWGCSFLFNAVLIRELGPLWVSAGRVGIGALGCWAFVFAFGKKLPRERAIYGHFLVLGILSYAIPFALFPLSQAYLASGVAAIINAMTPIMTVIVSQFWHGGEKVSWSKSAGVLSGFAGVAILASPALAAGGTSQIWAIAACLLATICYAVSLNYARNFKHIDPSILAACALSGATVAAVPAAFLMHGIPHLVTVEGWAAMLGIGLLATAFAFQIMYRLLPRIGATNFSVVTFIAPVSAILLGFTLLGETLKPEHIMGMIGIFIGLLLIDGRIVRRWQRAKT